MKIIEQDEDISLVEKIKLNNDEESLKYLIKKHDPMCFSLYKKYSNLINASGCSIEDLSASKDYLVYKSALSYDVTKKSKFSTWLYNQIRYQCLNTINQNKNLIPMESDKINFLLELNQSKNRDNSTEIKNMNEYLFTILESFADERILKIYKMRYFSGKKITPWSKIAKNLNISTQTAINLHKKGLKLLKTKINSNFYLERV